jgi:2-dehydropantoate 2-reductase
MRFVIYGAGGIGATIGARLHQTGVEVVLIARGDHLRALQDRGLRFVAPDGEHQLMIDSVGHPTEVEWRIDDVVLLAMKSQHTVEALEAMSRCAPEQVAVVCAQNGVANERMALRRRSHVYGMVVNLPALHLKPGEVVTHAAGSGGILDVGRYPSGTDQIAQTIAEQISAAGFSSRPDTSIMRWKYAKLLMNLGNALQAAVTGENSDPNAGPDEHSGEVARRLRREGLACFEAAGIDCASRDEVVGRHDASYHMVDLPGWPRTGGSSWQSVQRGTGDIETDFLNGEVALLGGLYGVATPANRICQQVARQMVSEKLPVGSFSGAEILAMIDAAAEAEVETGASAGH